MLSIVNDSALRLRDLIFDLLNLSRLETGRSQLKEAPCDLKPLITGMVRLLPVHPLHTVEIELPDDLPLLVLDAGKIHNTFHEAMQAEGWANSLPTNALLISGPSKTADIQQTLAYGAHGPKELVVLMLSEDEA